MQCCACPGPQSLDLMENDGWGGRNWCRTVSLVNNVLQTIINHPLGNGLYKLFMVIRGMVYYCFKHINVNTSVFGISHKPPNHTEAPGGDREGCGSAWVGQWWWGSPINEAWCCIDLGSDFRIFRGICCNPRKERLTLLQIYVNVTKHVMTWWIRCLLWGLPHDVYESHHH